MSEERLNTNNPTQELKQSGEITSNKDQLLGSKESEDSKKDPLQTLIDSNPCSKCRSAGIPICLGHGGGGGGGGSGGGSSGRSSQNTLNNPLNIANPNFVPGVNEFDNSLILTPTSGNQTNTLQANMVFNPDIIASLFAKTLTIENNRDLGILLIKCNPRFLSDMEKTELEKYISAVIKAFDEFKQENRLQENNCFARIERDAEGNFVSLKIAIANPKLYDAFIDKLQANNLLINPTMLKNIQRTQEPGAENAKRFRSPFSIVDGPKPSGYKEI